MFVTNQSEQLNNNQDQDNQVKPKLYRRIQIYYRKRTNLTIQLTKDKDHSAQQTKNQDKGSFGHYLSTNYKYKQEINKLK